MSAPRGWLAAVAAGIFTASPACGVCDTSPAAEPRRTIVFSPDRRDRCDYFFVTEFDAGVTGVTSQDPVDRFLFTDALGLMRNIDHSRAIGASIDAHLTGGAIRFAPTIRFKQWLAGRSSLDVSLGYAITTSIEQEGAIGPMGDVRYSPSAWFHVRAGVCRIRDITSIWYVPDYHVNGTRQVQLYVGAGLGGVPGVVSWGAQAIGFAGAALMFSGMD